MSAVLLNVMPIFLLILLGWIIARTGLLKPETGDALGEYVFKIGIPTLIFKTIAFAQFAGASPFRLWTSYFIAVAITWTAGHLAATRLFGQDAKIGVIAGMSGSFANSVFVGLPLVAHMVGESGLIALSILLAIHLPIMMITGTILMEGASAKVDGLQRRSIPAVIRQVGSNLVRHPLVLALASGVAFNLSGLPMPTIGKTVIDQIAASAGPAALISIGMALTRYPIRGDLGLATVTSLLKLMVLPSLVYLTSHLLGLPNDWAAALVLTSSVPTGINAWLISQKFRSGQSLSASVISITTAFSVFTVSFWGWLLS